MINLYNNILNAKISEEGAYLFSVKRGDKDLILQGNMERKTRGGMALLIPFANRIKEGKYTFEGKTYSLPVNSEGNAIHGFAKDVKWNIDEASVDTARLSVTLKNAGYPSTLKCKVIYALSGNSISVSIEINNVGDNDAPLTVGAHPYFVVKGKWSLNPEVFTRLELENKIPNGKMYEWRVDASSHIDDCFLFDGKVTLTSEWSRVEVESDNMKYLQIFNGVEGAVALEPMSGAPDAYNNGMGLTILRPQSGVEYRFKMTFG
ncbi:hypothetical protein IC006_0069 [Sulfuracidifex tepidarius]|uniref:Aldose 1-epimerase n=2 Tax=Sulfuracidifex tepidarius TaxID=1294262 RepID=A0A510DRN1_9CREN|nr:aldose 1-epimerase [Sulfuracidifex tepidarius]BBG22785.1 hypothetical protein IC006_0069 [Sulfuracidifex tepidarius]BBG25564.1 hypothetical protein IC007_0069 [Sulfuracidifex tepidarius]